MGIVGLSAVAPEFVEYKALLSNVWVRCVLHLDARRDVDWLIFFIAVMIVDDHGALDGLRFLVKMHFVAALHYHVLAAVLRQHHLYCRYSVLAWVFCFRLGHSESHFLLLVVVPFINLIVAQASFGRQGSDLLAGPLVVLLEPLHQHR